jgi:putative iron-regulated protein
MTAQWAPGGEARKHLEDSSDEAGLTAIMTGLGSLSYGELAGERMKLGLMIHDPEEEHDCFSDNTHASHFFDALGIRNVYLGTYRRADRSIVTGPSISDLVKAKSPEIDAEVRAKLDAPAIDALLDQTKSLERAVATLDLKAIKFEGSDSLDNPDKVQPESKAASDGGEGAN